MTSTSGDAISYFDTLVARAAPFVVWVLWVGMSLAAPAEGMAACHGDLAGAAANAALPSAATLALVVAVRRVRGRTRLADGFYLLVLLNPLLFARAAGPFDSALAAEGLLGLLAAIIIAMKCDRFAGYLAVALLAATLAWLSEVFIFLLPPLVAWLIYAGYSLARSKEELQRTRGIAVMAAAEAGLVLFGLACILIEPPATTQPATAFSAVVRLVEFPLLIVAIVMLALGWRRGPGGKAPPYFAGMLALLVGFMGMLLDTLSTGRAPPPIADHTAIVLSLVYTVFALQGPRRFQWLVPPILLVAAAMHTFLRR